jgi:murein L,D-transpeptidase YcbB/YkuD
VKTIEALGDALRVKNPVVKYQGKSVPSEELVVKIKDLQNKKGLTADGRVNPRTLKAAVAVEEARSIRTF